MRRALVLGAALAACAPEDPSITLLLPTDGATVCGTPLTFEIAVTGRRLEAPPADPKDAGPRTGHVDVLLNGQDAAMVWEDAGEIKDVDDGRYLLEVELSNGDHSPVVPYTADSVTIDVAAAACGG